VNHFGIYHINGADMLSKHWGIYFGLDYTSTLIVLASRHLV